MSTLAYTALERETRSPEETIRQEQIMGKLVTARDQLEAAYRNWPELSSEQKDMAMRLAVRAVAGLIRLSIYELESSGP